MYWAKDLSFFNGINCLDQIEKCLEFVGRLVEILFSHAVFGKIRSIQRFDSSVSLQTVFFTACQLLSMVFVHAPVSLFTNSLLWFTVRWIYPSLSKLQYAFQHSLMMVVPGRTNYFKIGRSISASLCSTVLKNDLLLSRSIPPNTHTPSTFLPRWYFLFPNFDSSISTVFPGPPILVLCFSKRTCSKLSFTLA